MMKRPCNAFINCECEDPKECKRCGHNPEEHKRRLKLLEEEGVTPHSFYLKLKKRGSK